MAPFLLLFVCPSIPVRLPLLIALSFDTSLSAQRKSSSPRLSDCRRGLSLLLLSPSNESSSGNSNPPSHFEGGTPPPLSLLQTEFFKPFPPPPTSLAPFSPPFLLLLPPPTDDPSPFGLKSFANGVCRKRNAHRICLPPYCERQIKLAPFLPPDLNATAHL